jgi:transcriptional repressor NrdR
MHGLLTATIKRNVPIEKLEGLIGDIEGSLRDEGISEISSQEIGRMVLLRLRDIDKVAYVRFASVYRDFKDIDEFNEELRSLTK